MWQAALLLLLLLFKLLRWSNFHRNHGIPSTVTTPHLFTKQDYPSCHNRLTIWRANDQSSPLMRVISWQPPKSRAVWRISILLSKTLWVVNSYFPPSISLSARSAFSIQPQPMVSTKLAFEAPLPVLGGRIFQTTNQRICVCRDLDSRSHRGWSPARHHLRWH